MHIKTLALFHCDNCGENIEMVTLPVEEVKMYCPRCGSNKNFYSFDDVNVQVVEKKKLH